MITIAFIVASGAICFLFIQYLDLITHFGFMIVFSGASMAISVLFGLLKVKALRQK
ncbi:Poxvirus A28 family [Gilliamella apicola SCGC AB-598-I20]|nr:Poxvirus A28 family [Gilliamella apicola SCGC AB-598-I20]